MIWSISFRSSPQTLFENISLNDRILIHYLMYKIFKLNYHDCSQWYLILIFKIFTGKKWCNCHWNCPFPVESKKKKRIRKKYVRTHENKMKFLNNNYNSIYKHQTYIMLYANICIKKQLYKFSSFEHESRFLI